MPLCALGLLALVIVQYIHEYISMWLWMVIAGYPSNTRSYDYRVCSYYHTVEMQYQYGNLDDDEYLLEQPHVYGNTQQSTWTVK